MNVLFNNMAFYYGYRQDEPVTVYDIRERDSVFGKEIEFLIYNKETWKWQYVTAGKFHPYEDEEGNNGKSKLD